jgi:UDP-N-acetylglucosamine 2-epimerase (non-hydrolysing)
MGLDRGRYAVLTLHRPANVDDPSILSGIVTALEAISASVPVVFPVHPRARRAIERAGLGDRVAACRGLRLLDPLGYLDFVGLLSDSMAVLTDSGGIQEETTVLGVPCLTLRDNTERPITIDEGTNTLVGREPSRIIEAFEAIERGEGRSGRVPSLWDGGAARRIVSILASREV